MSDGKKFIKTDANLSPEERLEVVERNYSVILGRIQSYDQVLVEFANINSDLQSNKQSISKIDAQLAATSAVIKEKLDTLYTRINDLKNSQDLLSNSMRDHALLHKQSSDNANMWIDSVKNEFYLLKERISEIETNQPKYRQSLSVLEKSLSDLKKSIDSQTVQLHTDRFDHTVLKSSTESALSTLKQQIDQLLTSFQELPQFNEWATKIYIKVCNEINDKQKAFYQELDKRSQQLQEKLASDPYTAESVKKILKSEMEALAMDGKNAYIKATNAAQQIQLLEKKVENISLILKKYELNK